MDDYREIYYAVSEMLTAYGLEGTDTFIEKCIDRVRHDADADWNSDDVIIAIRNTLNELIEKL